MWNTGVAGFYKYKDSGKFGTPSGKIELELQMYGNIGKEWPNPELPVEFKENEDKFPFILVNIRSMFLNNTGAWSHNNAQLRDPISGIDSNPILINPLDADKLDVKDGDLVFMESSTAKVSSIVQLTERIKPGCVGIIHGFGQTIGEVATLVSWINDNELIADAGSHLDQQDLCGGEAHVSTRVNIYK